MGSSAPNENSTPPHLLEIEINSEAEGPGSSEIFLAPHGTAGTPPRFCAASRNSLVWQ